MEVALARIYPTASIIAYDDGLGSYVGDIVHDHKLNIIWKLLGRRTDSIWPECLYVNNVEFCDSKLSKNKKKLLALENTKDNYSSMVYDIFGVSNSSVYDSRHLVYLSQPLGELGANMDRYEDLIENALNEFKEFGIYRKHPRDSRKTMLEFIQDDSNCIWELICGDRVDNNSVLIGIYSLAFSFANVLSVIWNALNNSWVPYYYKYTRENDFESIKIHSRNYAELFTVLASGFILLTPEVFHIFADETYWSGTNLIPLFAIGWVRPSNGVILSFVVMLLRWMRLSRMLFLPASGTT